VRCGDVIPRAKLLLGIEGNMSPWDRFMDRMHLKIDFLVNCLLGSLLLCGGTCLLLWRFWCGFLPPVFALPAVDAAFFYLEVGCLGDGLEVASSSESEGAFIDSMQSLL
jgi:hypothetical protein